MKQLSLTRRIPYLILTLQEFNKFHFQPLKAAHETLQTAHTALQILHTTIQTEHGALR